MYKRAVRAALNNIRSDKVAKQRCEVYSRVVGYLSPVSEWNKGKKEEFKQRKEYKIPKEAVN